MSGSVNANSQSLGVVYLVWGGTRIDVDSKSCSWNRGGSVSTPVVAGNKISQSQSTVPMKLTASFPLLAGMSLDALKAKNGQEMQIHCDSGQTYTSSAASFSGDPKVTGGSTHNVSAEWSGQPALEVIAS